VGDVSIELEPKVQSDSIVFAAHKTPVFSVAVQRCVSSWENRNAVLDVHVVNPAPVLTPVSSHGYR
jgi:hypothetical protein